MLRYYAEDGNKRKVLFIHGFMANELSFNSIKNLDKNFDMITVRLPFQGKLKDKVINIKSYTDEINQIIEEKQLKDFDVVGHSLGAPIALGIKNNGLKILVSPLNPFSKPNTEWLLPKDMNMAKDAIQNLIYDYSSKWNENTIEKMAAVHLFAATKSKDDLKFIVNNEITNEEYLKNQLFKKYEEHEYHVIYGENDKYIKSSEIEKIKEVFNKNTHKINNCGHSPIFEHPQETLSIINKILKESER